MNDCRLEHFPRRAVEGFPLRHDPRAWQDRRQWGRQDGILPPGAMRGHPPRFGCSWTSSARRGHSRYDSGSKNSKPFDSRFARCHGFRTWSRNSKPVASQFHNTLPETRARTGRTGRTQWTQRTQRTGRTRVSGNISSRRPAPARPWYGWVLDSTIDVSTTGPMAMLDPIF